MTKDEVKKAGVLQCRVCGNKVQILYQNNTCKACLVDSFQRLRGVINYYRENDELRGGQNSD